MKKLIQYLILSFSLIISVSSYADFLAINNTGTTGGEGANITVKVMCAGYVPYRFDIGVGKKKNIPFDPKNCTALTIAHGDVQFPQYPWGEGLTATFKGECSSFKGNGPVIVTGHCKMDALKQCTRGSIRLTCPNN